VCLACRWPCMVHKLIGPDSCGTAAFPRGTMPVYEVPYSTPPACSRCGATRLNAVRPCPSHVTNAVPYRRNKRRRLAKMGKRHRASGSSEHYRSKEAIANLSPRIRLVSFVMVLTTTNARLCDIQTSSPFNTHGTIAAGSPALLLPTQLCGILAPISDPFSVPPNFAPCKQAQRQQNGWRQLSQQLSESPHLALSHQSFTEEL
jgi:hypothetical protein